MTIYNGSLELQTYDFKRAQKALEDGFSVYIAHPNERFYDEQVWCCHEIEDADGHLFVWPINKE